VQQYCVLCAFHSPFSPELVAVSGVPLAAVLPLPSLSATGVAGAASLLGAAVEAAVAASHVEAAAVARRQALRPQRTALLTSLVEPRAGIHTTFFLTCLI
jgi:hypothetical protein